jgi:hypothetical protein
MIAQASTQAWAKFDSTDVHQAHVNGSGVSTSRRRYQRRIHAGRAWQRGLPPSTKDPRWQYVTVTVARRAGRGPASLRTARAVTMAALAAVPQWLKPVPPPR